MKPVLGRRELMPEVPRHSRRLTTSRYLIIPACDTPLKYLSSYVVNAARAAKTDDPSHAQHLVYLSVRTCRNNQHVFSLTIEIKPERRR